MATVHLFPLALTTSTPRVSPAVSYSGSGQALFRVVSPTWATDDPAIQVAFAVQQSFDGGATWADMCAAGFQPQSFGKGGQLPPMGCSANDAQGARQLRAVLSASAPITVGIDATVS
jgi:hypothetical protein